MKINLVSFRSGKIVELDKHFGNDSSQYVALEKRTVRSHWYSDLRKNFVTLVVEKIAEEHKQTSKI